MEVNIEKLAKKLESLKSICIDSSILIYHLEQIKPYEVLTKLIIEKVASGSIFCNISALTITELLAKPYREKDYTKISVFEEFINSLPNSKIQPVEYNVAKLVASLRANYNLKTPDSILLSTVLYTDSEYFVTNDVLFKKINIKDVRKDISILLLDEYLHL